MMKKIGLPISNKENENRRAIVPEHIKLMRNPEYIYIEEGYGRVLGIDDDEYRRCGCHICSHEDCLYQDVVCDPKIGDADYLKLLHEGQMIFGWIHATQNRKITEIIISRKLIAFAWEHMYDNGRHIFWRNNELAGEAAVMHAFRCYGKMPYETDVAVIGSGNTARGAIKVLNMLGAKVMQYNRRTECLLRDEINRYDVIINCVLWDVMREDHIINKKDLSRMKKNAMIVDVSCDKHGGIETSRPTTIENPVYEVDGILHYVVDHTPALFYKTFTWNNSSLIYPFLEQLITGELSDVIKNCLIIEKGNIIDSEIKRLQNR